MGRGLVRCHSILRWMCAKDTDLWVRSSSEFKIDVCSRLIHEASRHKNFLFWRSTRKWWG